jgi:hypothetical protein
VFGVDSTTKEQDNALPVVVAIGGNYTQSANAVPRDSNSLGFEVEENLLPCRINLKAGLEHYRNNTAKWVGNCVASQSNLKVPNENAFHLVMTNFCIWITKDSWQNIGTSTRAQLSEINPPFNSLPTYPGAWSHLEALYTELKDVQIVWIGHGIHSEVFSHFRQFMRSKRNSNWLLMPNLAYWYDYAKWNHLKQCPDGNYM